jgi:hypothetical protein
MHGVFYRHFSSKEELIALSVIVPCLRSPRGGRRSPAMQLGKDSRRHQDATAPARTRVVFCRGRNSK